jgi:hypothetical protein
MDANMPLTDMEVRSAKPGARLVKLSDGGGLQLWIMPDGAPMPAPTFGKSASA